MQYKDAANLLAAVSEVMTHFERYMTVDRIQTLSRKYVVCACVA